MKLGDIVYAEPAISSMSKKHFTDFSVAYNLAMMYELVEDKIKFFVDQEKFLIDKYSAKDEKGEIRSTKDGRIIFDKSESKTLFDSEIAKLKDTEIEGFSVVSIKESSFVSNSDYPTPEDIVKLKGFVNFELSAKA